MFLFPFQIIPNDADRYDWEKCQCYEIGEPPLPRRECVSACTLTETEYFTVSGKNSFDILSLCAGTPLVLCHNLRPPEKERKCDFW